MTISFAELGLNEQILAGVKDLGFEEPTPVQEQAIPYVLAGRDVVASAQTGTGKTAAFTLPTLQLIAAMARETVPAMAIDIDVPPQTRAEDSASEEGETQEAESIHEQPSLPPSNDEAPSSVDETVSSDAPSENPPRKRRRRRRRRKRVEGNPSTEASAEQQPASSHERPTEPTSEPAPVAASSSETQASGTSTNTDVSADTTASASPRRRRRRRRRKKVSASNAPLAPKAPTTPLALVITPTRELAQQIERVAEVVCGRTGQRAVIVMGGARFEQQIRQLQLGCDLLVATPGRLIDLMDRDIVDLSMVRILVLDEADRMLDMGFWPSVRRIMQALPAERQNLLFSATIPPSIKGTLDAMLRNPATVEIARIGETADTVEEHLCPVTQGQKTQLLRALIEHDQSDRVLVFCRTKHRTDDVFKTLKAAGLKAEVMHADRPQQARDKALRRFREGTVQLLIATDVMSRGIDVSGIDAVVNYDVPMDPEDYVHRIGRTGRAGHTGHAYTFVAPDEISPLREIEYFTHKLIPVWDLEGFAYDEGRIIPNPSRSTEKPMRTMFSGSRARNRGPRGGRFGRHY